LNQGLAVEAAEALSAARALDRERSEYQLALARALVALGRIDAGRETLMGLRRASPEDPQVNIALAELEARAGRSADAIRYFQSALHGAWAADDLDERRALRRRIVDYLLEQRMASRAIAQLLLLQDDVPAAADSQADIAALFLRAGDAARALTGYRRALANDPGHAPALAGAARAAFALGDYRSASRYLARIRRDDPALTDLRAMTTAILASDPLARGLSGQERRRRVSRGAAAVAARLQACKADLATGLPPALAEHAARLARLSADARRTITLEDAIAVVDDAAVAVPNECQSSDVEFRAWLLLARARGEEGA
jgi:predicted Zn-dependent protease